MKIEVNEQQPLDDVVVELVNQGYKEDNISSDNPRFTYTGSSGHYFLHKDDIEFNGNLTTLQELREMK